MKVTVLENMGKNAKEASRFLLTAGNLKNKGLTAIADALITNADKIFDSASELQKISRAVQNAANSAPSYNGQFGPKVKAIGNAACSQGMQQSYDLQSKAGDLKNRANKFDNTDKKSIISKIKNWINNLFGNNKILQKASVKT